MEKKAKDQVAASFSEEIRRIQDDKVIQKTLLGLEIERLQICIQEQQYQMQLNGHF
jgi:hypothetical protein